MSKRDYYRCGLCEENYSIDIIKDGGGIIGNYWFCMTCRDSHEGEELVERADEKNTVAPLSEEMKEELSVEEDEDN